MTQALFMVLALTFSSTALAADTGYHPLTYVETKNNGDVVFRLSDGTSGGYAVCPASSDLNCLPILLSALVSQREVKVFYTTGDGSSSDAWTVTALRIN